MLTHPLRRVIAACASVLLVLGLVGIATSPSEASSGYGTFTGRVVGPDGKGIPDVPVGIYKLDYSGEWKISSYTWTDGGTDPEQVGRFRSMEYGGTYRLLLNAGNDPELLWTSEYFDDASDVDEAKDVVVSVDTTTELPDMQLEPRGALVAGRVTNYFNQPVVNAHVRMYPMTGGNGYPLSDTYTDANGDYVVRGIPEPFRLTFTTGEYLASTSIENLAAPAGDVVAGQNVQMLSKPIALASTPTVTGTLRAGETLKTTGGSWYPSKVTKKYQWYYLKSGTVRTISGATKSYIGLHSTDYGKRFRVRVTASYPGVTSKVVTSGWSRPLLRNSSVSISGSSPSRGKVKLYATVDAAGAKATGRVRFTCATPAAVFASKTVTLSSEKASATFYNLPKSKMTCRASYAGTSTIKASSRSKTIYVK